MQKLVKDYMTAEVVTIGQSESLTKGVEILSKKQFRHLPVVNENNEVLGIISDRDLRNLQTAMSFIEEAVEGLKSEISLADVMTEGVLTVLPETPLREAASILIEKKYGALPVVENGKISGIISYTDILRAYIDIENSL